MRLNLRHGGEEGDGIRVLRLLEDLLDGAHLDHRAEIHHGNAVREVANDIEVMADEEVGEPLLLAQLSEKIEHLALDGDVERGDWLVEHDELRIDGERASDADALSLAARKLVRIARGIVWIEPNKVEHFAHALAASVLVAQLMREEPLFDLVTDWEAWVE